jgi:hypothetical protein
MTDATAKYILTAEDQTKSAIASVKAGFQTLHTGIGEVTKSLKLMTEIFVGGRLLHEFRKLEQAIVSAASSANKEFAGALGSVKENFAALLEPKGGMAEATEKMQELAKVLKDPDLVAAADHITSTLITGFESVGLAVAHAVANLNSLVNGPARLSGRLANKISDLEAERSRLAPSDEPTLGSRYTPADGKRVAQIDKELKAASEAYVAASKAETQADKEAVAAAEALLAAKQHMLDIKAQGIRLAYELKRSMDEVDAGGKFLEQFDKADKDAEALTKTAVEHQIEQWNKYYEALDLLRAHNLIDDKTYNDRSKEYIDDNLQEVQVSVKHMVLAYNKANNQMEEFALQAARNMQSAFANYLFDPFHNGLKGMLLDFINVIRRMVAEAAASKLFGMLGSKAGGGGFLGFLGGLIGGAGGAGAGGAAAPGTGNFVGPRASGGSVAGGSTYLVGEQGPELFTPRSSGQITSNAMLTSGSGISYAPTFNFGNANPDREVLLVWADRIRKQTISDMTGLIRGGAFR